MVGDFNGWQPGTHQMRRRANDTLSASVTVLRGTSIRFRYLAENGHWFNDPEVAVAREIQTRSWSSDLSRVRPGTPVRGLTSAINARKEVITAEKTSVDSSNDPQTGHGCLIDQA